VADVGTALSSLEAAGVRAVPVGSAVRFTTHRDLSLADVDEALRRMAPLVPSLKAA
jgi:threonine aldolase